MPHWIVQCSVCGRVVAECKCPRAKNKEKRYEVCSECRAKGRE
jgi:hypothetical protein